MLQLANLICFRWCQMLASDTLLGILKELDLLKGQMVTSDLTDKILFSVVKPKNCSSGSYRETADTRLVLQSHTNCIILVPVI